jgi:DNA-binding transcriptional ArsR family regulator|tara:strand:- start:2269 stop:2538 length:270 start_codon:yes stop_codon:yes gene_type:complete
LIEILEAEQVKISKQLRYMKELGMVEGERQAQWMVYRLKDAENPLLVENLKCLQECSSEHLSFGTDLKKRSAIVARLSEESVACAPCIC